MSHRRVTVSRFVHVSTTVTGCETLTFIFSFLIVDEHSDKLSADAINYVKCANDKAQCMDIEQFLELPS